MYVGIHVEYVLFLSEINENLKFPNRFSENFMKILPLCAELSHVVGKTEVTKVIVTFRNFANAPKKDSSNNINFFTMARTFSIVTVHNTTRRF